MKGATVARMLAIAAMMASVSASALQPESMDLLHTQQLAADSSGAPVQVGGAHESSAPPKKVAALSFWGQVYTTQADEPSSVNCFSAVVFATLMNTANLGLDAAKGLTVTGGTKTGTIIMLIIILVIGLFLLLMGETLLQAAVIAVTFITSFMVTLYLWIWCFERNPTEWVRCILPFALAIASCLIITGIVTCLIKKIFWLAFFIMGAAGGTVGMWILRDFILVGNPQLLVEPLFNLYWLALVVVAIICGIVAVCLKTAVVVTVTAALGAYAVSASIIGLIPVCGGSAPASWAFFVAFGCFAVFGILFQIFIGRKIFGDRRADHKFD